VSPPRINVNRTQTAAAQNNMETKTDTASAANAVTTARPEAREVEGPDG